MADIWDRILKKEQDGLSNRLLLRLHEAHPKGLSIEGISKGMNVGANPEKLKEILDRFKERCMVESEKKKVNDEKYIMKYRLTQGGKKIMDTYLKTLESQEQFD